MADLLARRAREKADAYEAQWDGGRGSHHPDFDPTASGEDIFKASRRAAAEAGPGARERERASGGWGLGLGGATPRRWGVAGIIELPN